MRPQVTSTNPDDDCQGDLRVITDTGAVTRDSFTCRSYCTHRKPWYNRLRFHREQLAERTEDTQIKYLFSKPRLLFCTGPKELTVLIDYVSRASQCPYPPYSLSDYTHSAPDTSLAPSSFSPSPLLFLHTTIQSFTQSPETLLLNSTATFDSSLPLSHRESQTYVRVCITLRPLASLTNSRQRLPLGLRRRM